MERKPYANRAVALINQRCAKLDRPLAWVLKEAHIPDSTFRGWERGKYNPTAPYLEAMARAGYDVIYILTGEKRDGG